MDTLFQNFWAISQKVQNLKVQAEKNDVTPKIRVDLHKALETLQDSLENLKQGAFQTQSHVLGQFEEMEGQIISLYRVVEERFEKYEIQKISKEAFALSDEVQSGNLVKVAKKVGELKQNLLYLFKHRSPSMQDRKVLHIAGKMSEEANSSLTCTDPGHNHLKFVQILKILLQEALTKAQSMVTFEEAELAMEFYELADLFQRGREKEAKLRLQLMRSRLSDEQLEKLENSDNLMETLLELAGSEDRAINYHYLSAQSI